MLRSFLRTVLIGLAIACAPAAAHATGSALSESQAQAVRDLVRQTLIDNPEILVEALDALKERRAAEQAEAHRAAIRAHAADLIRADDPFLGKASAKITVVEFFDYNCGYCRAALEDIRGVLAANPDTRVVLKDLPVLGDDSAAVSRLALAARAQGRYADFHVALLSFKGRLNQESALSVAAGLKLDVARLKKDAASKTVEDALARNLTLAENMGISGTPSFLFGDALFPGRIDPDTFAKALAAMRGAGK